MMRVNEIFYSLQGEGHFTGCPAIFVRLSGCNRACPFCDTDFASFTEMTEEEIVNAVSTFPAEIVVITGGEPAMQLTDSLVRKLHAIGKRVHVETNGSLPLPESLDWVTCSPKTPPYGIQRINELKLLFTPGVDPETVAATLPKAQILSLQPLAGEDPAPTIDYILAHPAWRLSLQTHKLLQIR
ncbi:MAG: radical SAM protein [Bacteroides sp.]|nr:radical SAM protein [Bacteroides sp.]MBD5294641.1 radical SAM protein [Bacteroides sp.]MBD5360970.1 radical SAM protein [Bacteroides sp.]MBD5365318.1 radical SAM protein [Bacteroides sp.]